MSLPTREQFEEWSSAQVASFLSQNKMRECAVTVQRMKIDGRRFLNLSDNDLSKFGLIHRPQIQKIVQDIKKNDDSILNRLKRFQTEQTANILKTGRNTIERLKNKGPPKVPARDYPGDNQDFSNQDLEQSDDSDFDNDLYEDPQGDYNYEPPPCERTFNPPRKMYSGGDYLDARSSRQMQTKPMMPFLPNKPPIPEKPKQAAKYDEDYIDPEEDIDDDYIDPSEKDHPGMQSGRSYSPDVYEVPDQGNSPSISRCSSKLKAPALQLPPKPSPRLNIKKPVICPGPEDKNGHDTHFDECSSTEDREERKIVEERRPSIPVPLPREVNNPKPLLFQKPSIPNRDNEVRDPAPAVASLPTTSSSFHLVNRSLQRDLCQKSPLGRGSLSQEDSATKQQEEEAGVYKKPWYASNCDRKTAEDTLTRSAKDGSYMVRKSSGVDALQPYTLVVFYNGRVYNIPVRYIPATKQYALGKQKNGEERFKTVSEIIENHQKSTLVLVDMQSNTKDSTTLKHAIKP